MSVFDLPRLHFAGTATTRLPTGPKSGLVDLATNTALTASGPADMSTSEYHAYLDGHSPRFDADGRPCDDGPFTTTKGWNFAGNGHFAVDARIVGVELAPGDLDVSDPVVGRSVDLWGHYNPYLATTVNRARVFDVDPASDWTTTLMVGQFCFGRAGRSHDAGYLFSGGVSGFAPPRWHHLRYVRDVGDHPFAPHLRRSVVHQFVTSRDDPLWRWPAAEPRSPAVAALRELTDSTADGLVVQFTLGSMATPRAPGVPNHWELRGTIAPWHADESRTYPAGRLLVPTRTGALHTLTVDVTPTHATFNLVNAVPLTTRAPRPGPGPTHAPGPRLDLGDLELRGADGRLVAVLPRDAYREPRPDGGLVVVPVVDAGAADQALRIVGGGTVLLAEREVNVQADDACLFLEHSGDEDVEVRTYLRGRPSAHEVHIGQYVNAKATPFDRTSDVVHAKSVLHTDERGRGTLTLHGARAGTARILLSPTAEVPDLDYDHDDALGFWPGAGWLAVRVLPDDRRLDDIADEDVTFDVLHREVFAYYEHLYSFMRDEVFSLDDAFRVHTYARLIWQMSDPANKAKTYYMPPTRDLTAPQARLLLAFLRKQHEADATAPVVGSVAATGPRIVNRGDLLRALHDAATIELAVMLQYLYAAFSLPTYGAARDLVRRGEWRPEHLGLVCGDGGETRDGGIRGTLLAVAREEMIHFLLVNNVIMAIGEPFHVPDLDFGTVNSRLPIPLDFALEPLGIGSVQRFIAIERPDDGTTHPYGDDRPYGSLSELYADIREGLCRVPDLFLVEKGRGGGEHHLFLRESINAVHPDYQLEVDDLASALFAIDVVTEQGEGNVLTAADGGQSHFATFLRISDLLMTETLGAERRGKVPWTPAYPVVRNPTLRPGNPATEPVSDPDARTVLTLFNKSYFMMFQLMLHHFGHQPDASLRRSDLMNMAIEIMTGVLRPTAEVLVRLPSGRRGRTAGPSFELIGTPGLIPRPDVAWRSLALRFDHLAAATRRCGLIPDSAVDTLGFLAAHFHSRPRRGRT
ncbi:hypothetical protein GCM10022243_38080 [Saccharothrix violaceirubra]|uniref:Iminophenyl-pyruvate dimer synthase domain-containing protein n=1 Tax=Saccharothrix violaceirubra TaxID=413306 RepID=A0A7W7T489_9PSEU|nr:ferritin-like domain-containing protein [Saccharothrix violaceirubra]MBB4966278.1 hypothetical protein [Saccharothrix violaceirubra]